MSSPTVHPLSQIAESLNDALAPLTFAPPVAYTYNPWRYARALRDAYFARWGQPGPRRVLFVGMNPGPWGMAQTGVPFGEVGVVRDWLGLRGELDLPDDYPVHPKRPLQGLACPRSEVSGARLWGWLRARWGTPEALFQDAFVHNWCPLAFLEASGANRTPDRLPAAERAALFPPCDQALRAVAELFTPRLVVGVGRFAAQRATLALDGLEVAILPILHPSPANPQANHGWAEQVEAQLSAALTPPAP